MFLDTMLTTASAFLLLVNCFSKPIFMLQAIMILYQSDFQQN